MKHSKEVLASNSKSKFNGDSRWLTVSLAAHYSNTTRWYIRTLIWEGKVAFLKAGGRYLIDRADLDAFFESQKAVSA